MKQFIKGKPAPFATKLEKEWKDSLRAQIPENRGKIIHRGIKLIFHLESFYHNSQPFDLDNLVEPVLSVVVNEKGYFGGRRPNIKWWYARKIKDTEEGLELELSTNTPPSLKGRLILDETYNGELPKSAKSEEFPQWIISKRINPIGKDDRVSLYLIFPEEVNIGDIATGRVKATIDCLYPLLGGQAGKPEDWKIEELVVEKEGGNWIRIKIYFYEEVKL